MDQNRILLEIQNDDAILVQKFSNLQSKLRKTNRTIGTQTEKSLVNLENQGETENPYKISSTSFSSPPSLNRRDRQESCRPTFRY